MKFLEAHEARREGRVRGVAALAADALERAMVYLEARRIFSLGNIKGAQRHRKRREYAAKIVPLIGRATIERGWDLRNTDSYYGSERRGFPDQIYAPEEERVDALLENVLQIFLAVGERHLDPPQRKKLAHQLDLRRSRGSKDRTLSVIEGPLIVGAFNTPANQELDILAFEVVTAELPCDEHSRGRILLLLAHRAMHQGEYVAAINLVRDALEAMRNLRDPYRVHHLHKIQAACFRELRRPREAVDALERAFLSADGDQKYLNTLENERSVQHLLTLGREAAVRHALHVYGHAVEIGDSALIARRKATALSVLAEGGEVDRAAELGDDTSLWFESENAIGKAYHVEAHLKLALKRGDLDKASGHARLLAALARPRKLRRLMQIAEGARSPFIAPKPSEGREGA